MSINAFGEPEVVFIGGLPFTKEGSLLQGEDEWFQYQSDRKLSSLQPIYQLADDIAKEFNIEDSQALELVQGVGDNDLYQKVLLKFFQQLLDAKNQAYTETDFQRETCTMMIQSRVDPEYLSANVAQINRKLKINLDAANPQWTNDMTRRLSSKTIREIIQFTTNEKTEWTLVTPADSEEDKEVSLGN